MSLILESKFILFHKILMDFPSKSTKAIKSYEVFHKKTNKKFFIGFCLYLYYWLARHWARWVGILLLVPFITFFLYVYRDFTNCSWYSTIFMHLFLCVENKFVFSLQNIYMDSLSFQKYLIFQIFRYILPLILLEYSILFIKDKPTKIV